MDQHISTCHGFVSGLRDLESERCATRTAKQMRLKTSGLDARNWLQLGSGFVQLNSTAWTLFGLNLKAAKGLQRV